MTAAQKKQFASDATEVRRRLARAAGHPEEDVTPIKLSYLTHLACMDGSQNPSLLTAMPIVETTKKWAHLLQIPTLTLDDLLVPTTKDGKPVTTAKRGRRAAPTSEA
jgi:hypothetical protein